MTETDRPRRLRRAMLLAGAAIAALNLSSCSSEAARPPLHPVRGSATFRGKPAAKAIVVLRPVSGAKDNLPHAEVGEDGQFRIGTYTDADGAPVGDYAVTITWPETRKDPVTGDDIVEDRLRGRFAVPEKPLLKAAVKEGDNQLQPFRLD